MEIYAVNRYAEFSSTKPFAPADKVEAWLQKHFDVTTEYLRTASTYDAQKNVYEILGGGGGWITVALAAEQVENQIIIKVGSLGVEETIPTPLGILTLAHNLHMTPPFSSLIVTKNKPPQ